MILALALAAAPAAASAPSTPATVATRVDAVAARAGLAGVVLVGKGDHVLVERGYGAVVPGGARRHRADARWRLASISKQVTAALLMKDVAAGRLALDRPVATAAAAPKSGALGAVTLRQLLTHHSGLANPDDTARGPGGVPSFYAAAAPDLGYCLTRPAVPGSDFAYDNCDYLVAATLLRAPVRWPAGMTIARTGERLVPGYVGGKPEPIVSLPSFGAAGALTGTARDVFRFDRALMTGALLPAAARAELWKPEGGRSYQALGQWVFPGKLAGCAAAKRIVQRDGEIGGVQTRNYILPDDDISVVVFTNRSSDDFAIGEIWQGRGFAYDLLSAVACG